MTQHSVDSNAYLLTYLLTYSMEQSPGEANRFSASQEITRILWNPKVRYRNHTFLCEHFVTRYVFTDRSC
jgi:hypothetical protein